MIVGAAQYLNGYAFGAIQGIMLLNIHKIQHKMYIIMLTYGIRMGVIFYIVDPRVFSPVVLIRHFIIDAFMMYIYYSTEKTSRAVFQNFYENREELLKFKELLADSLPQSIAIIDCSSQKQLFSNTTFTRLFDRQEELDRQPEPPTSPIQSPPLIREDINVKKNPLSCIQVDVATIREVGSIHSEESLRGAFDSFVCLDDIIKNLTKQGLIQRKVLSLTASYKWKDQVRSFEVTLKRVKWDRSEAIAIIFNDITYQENLISLKLANINKDKIIATVSHELRTPLHGIIGLLGMTINKVNNAFVEEHLTLCKDNAHLLLGLVNSLLDFHQIGLGKLRLNITKIELRSVIHGIVKLFQYQCNEKGIYLHTEIDKDVPFYITTDENRLKQVLINLIGNAFKFTSKGGIKVQVEQDLAEKEYLLISIIDTGIGIREEDKGKLFKMYGRLEDGESVNKNGVGLGLTISNALTLMLNREAVGKDINVISQYSKGSTFYFKLLTNLSPEIDIKNDVNKKSVSIQPRDIIEEDDYEAESFSAHFQDIDSPGGVEFKMLNYTQVQKSQTTSRDDGVRSRINSREFFLNSSRTGYNINRRVSVISENNTQMNFQADSNALLAEKDGLNKLNIPFSTKVSLKYILVVDDNPFNLLIAKNLIEALGYSVKTALGGYAAIDQIKKSESKGETIQAIFMDCQMPIMDGFETSRTIVEMMKRGEMTKIPIIAWTANNSEKDIKRCYESGMSDYLEKPTSSDGLIRVLSRIAKKD